MALRVPRTGEAEPDRKAAEQAADLGPILKAPLLKATKVGRFSLTAAVNKQIPHGLSRVPAGWLVVDNDAFADVRRESVDSLSLTLRANNDVSFDLWVW